MRTIHALGAEAPGLFVIPGLDFEWLISDKAASRLVHTGFRE